MGNDFGTFSFAMTKADYDRQEKEGKITRPITDRGMKVGPGRYNSAPDTPTKGNEKTDRRLS